MQHRHTQYVCQLRERVDGEVLPAAFDARQIVGAHAHQLRELRLSEGFRSSEFRDSSTKSFPNLLGRNVAHRPKVGRRPVVLN